MNKTLKIAASSLIVATGVLAFAGVASADSTRIAGVASCLADNGTFSVTWTVTPNPMFGHTVTLSSTGVTFSPATIGTGQQATGSAVYSGSSAEISVNEFWLPTEAVSIRNGSVPAPTTPCNKPEVPPTVPPSDVCVNIDGVQTQVPAGHELSGGRCLVTTTTTALTPPTTTIVSSQPPVTPAVASAAVGPAAPAAAAPAPAPAAQLPATGLSTTQALIALMLLSLGGVAVVASRRFGSAEY